jgi:hypothetical protein
MFLRPPFRSFAPGSLVLTLAVAAGLAVLIAALSM